MKKSRVIFSISMLCTALCMSCQSDGTISQTDNYEAQIYPDYRDVTIPCNIAPMNFSVEDSSATDYALLIEAGDSRIWVNGDDGDFDIDRNDWSEMLTKVAGNGKEGKVSLTIAREIDGQWVGGKPFTMTVVPDSIDSYISYRLVPPGYESWYRMGLYQHELGTSEQTVIYENSHNQGACMNCHTPSSRNGNRTLYHQRTYNSGTYLMMDGKVERLDTKTDSTISAFVYPAWHPNGKLIAFSNNMTSQVFHTSDKDRVEVFDAASDIVVYDVEKHEAFSTPLLRTPRYWETYPTFSPDGKWLYFCSAPGVRDPGLNYKDVKYSLCRIAFDAEKQEFGEKIDTVISSSRDLRGRSVSFARISPDGNYLVCTVHNYGNFSIWHRDADLYMVDLRKLDQDTNPQGNEKEPQMKAIMPMTKVNSTETESYHTWSSNSRWLVFSSRRDDGLHTRPYFTYIDKEGNAHKPFMLPQQNPRKHYAQLDYSYNIPEFMTSAVSVSCRDIYDATKSDSVKVKWR